MSVQLFFIHWMLLYGFAGGSATFISQFYGVRDFKNIRKTTGFALTIAMGIGLLFFIAGFFFPEYILRIFTKYPEVIETGVGYVRIGSFTFLMLSITCLLYTSGVGAARRLSSVNWGIVKDMGMTWVLTFPGCGLIGFLMAKLFMWIF